MMQAPKLKPTVQMAFKFCMLKTLKYSRELGSILVVEIHLNCYLADLKMYVQQKEASNN